MIGVNSIHSSGRMRSRSLCSVRSGRDSRDTDPFRYPRTPRSRSLKPLAFPDLLGKTQDGQQHRQSRKKKVEPGAGFSQCIRFHLQNLSFRHKEKPTFFREHKGSRHRFTPHDAYSEVLLSPCVTWCIPSHRTQNTSVS